VIEGVVHGQPSHAHPRSLQVLPKDPQVIETDTSSHAVRDRTVGVKVCMIDATHDAIFLPHAGVTSCGGDDYPDPCPVFAGRRIAGTVVRFLVSQT
jgi:hypothetical protein